MGGLLGRNKDPNKKPFPGFSLCPGRSKKGQQSLRQTPPSKPTPVKETDWTDVHLQVPEFFPDISSQIIEDPPFPPPRKKRNKTLTIEKETVEKAITLQASAPNENRVPIEEPIIIPKKVPIHICDGSHKHCTNIINGVVIQTTHTPPKRSKKEPKVLSSVRPKNVSTVSLPNVDELKHKLKDKKPSKNNSATSLPADTDITISPTTTARLEDYMARCKSFSELPSIKHLEKIQDTEHHSDSEESWDALNDWGIEMIEDRSSQPKSPVEPKSRLESPYLVKMQEIKEPIELKHNTERRESIDDFFDTRAVGPYSKILEEVKNETSLGRRGSDGFFTEAPQLNTLRSDIFHTQTFLESESYTYDRPKTIEKPKIEPELSKEDQDDLLETFEEFYSKDEPGKKEPPKEKSANVQHSNLLRIIQENSDVIEKSLSDDDKSKQEKRNEH